MCSMIDKSLCWCKIPTHAPSGSTLVVYPIDAAHRVAVQSQDCRRLPRAQSEQAIWLSGRRFKEAVRQVDSSRRREEERSPGRTGSTSGPGSTWTRRRHASTSRRRCQTYGLPLETFERWSPAPKALERFREEVRRLTRRTAGKSLRAMVFRLDRYLQGCWGEYL
jgi:hypothetical protein